MSGHASRVQGNVTPCSMKIFLEFAAHYVLVRVKQVLPYLFEPDTDKGSSTRSGGRGTGTYLGRLLTEVPGGNRKTRRRHPDSKRTESDDKGPVKMIRETSLLHDKT